MNNEMKETWICKGEAKIKIAEKELLKLTAYVRFCFYPKEVYFCDLCVNRLKKLVSGCDGCTFKAVSPLEVVG